MERITVKEAKKYIALKENYSDKSVEAAAYFTLTPSKNGRWLGKCNILYC